MPILDRDKFKPDPNTSGYLGLIEAGRWHVECGVYTRTGNWERTWATCEAILSLVTERFDEVEDAVMAYAPKLNHWLEEVVTPEELGRRMLAAMMETKTVAVSAGDSGWGSAYFDGPDYVHGHAVEVVVNETGQLIRVGIAG